MDTLTFLRKEKDEMWANFDKHVKALDIAVENARIATKALNEAEKESEKCKKNLHNAEDDSTEADKEHNELSNDLYKNFRDIINDEDNEERGDFYGHGHSDSDGDVPSPAPEFNWEYITAYCKAKDIVEGARIGFLHAELIEEDAQKAYKEACKSLKAAKRATKRAIKDVKIAKRNYDEMRIKAHKASNSFMNFAMELLDSMTQPIAAN